MRPSGKKPRRIPEFSSESERGEFYRNKALYYLEFKMRTEAEVRTYLKEWQCPEDVLEDVILFLEEYHYLDDARYVQSYVRQERELHHRSRKDITFRLAAKGISSELIRQAFEDEEGENVELGQVERLIEKRMRSGAFDPEQTAAYLQRKGFSYAVIRQAMEGLRSIEDE